MHHNNENMPDKVVKASKRVDAYSYDTEAWAVLIREAQAQKIEDARSVYEKLVTTFATSGKYWKLYIEHEVHRLCFLFGLFPKRIKSLNKRLSLSVEIYKALQCT